MRKTIYFLFTAAFMLFCSSAFTQSTTTFIKALDNNGVILDGGSVVALHAKEIEAFSYSQGISACAACSTANLQDFNFLMSLNAASITAKQMLLKGLHLRSVDVSYRKSGATFDYYKIHMEDVAITSVQESGSSEIPTIAVSFAPQKIAWQYSAQKTDGSVGTKTKGGWDFGSNTEWLYY